MKMHVLIGMIAVTLLSACGGGGGGAGPGAGSGDDASLSQVQIAQTVRNALSNPDAPFIVKSHALAQAEQHVFTSAKNTSNDVSYDLACQDGGSVVWSMTDNGTTQSADGLSGTADLTVLYQFQECAAPGSLSVSDGSCNYNVVMDGQIACSVTGVMENGVMTLSANCGTSTLCDGIAITINGAEHSYGFAMGGEATGNDFDTLFGEILTTASGQECVDNATITYGQEVAVDASVASAVLSCSE